MNIQKNFESSILGVGDNYIILSDVQSYVDVVYTVRGAITEQFTFCYIANNGIIKINLHEVTTLVYDNLENYQDPFDYEADKLYTETDAYHYIKLDMLITDGHLDEIQLNDITIINAALDRGECLVLPSMIDKVITYPLNPEIENVDGLNFDLNRNLRG